MPLSIWAVKVCWNSLSTASLKDLSINHVKLYAADFFFQISKFHSYKYDWGKTNIWIRVSWSCSSTASLKNPFLNRLCEIMKNHVFQKVIVINALYSDMKYCVDWKSEGATKHMSSQGMLEQLVNSIIEGPLNKSCKTSFFPDK